MTEFFIRRPILACSIAILTVIAGVVCMLTLPVAQFPNIVPGTVNVTTQYPGASAELTADIVTTPLEQQINGTEGMLYFSSISSSNGTTSIVVTFEIDYDLDIGQVEIQNAVQDATGGLPSEVQQIGIDVSKQSTDFVALISLYSPNGTYDGDDLGNYAQINLVDPLSRVPGVGNVQNFGLREYSIRVWLDPVRMAELGLNAQDVVMAIKQQNTVIPVGSIGTPPVPGRVAIEYQVNALAQLPDPEAFADIIVRSDDDGALLRIKDIGRVELGSQNYAWQTTLNGKGSATLGIFQRPGSNTFSVLKGVGKALDKLSERFPADIEYETTFNTTIFVKTSMRELVVTLVQAIGLVVLVVFIFLQSVRTTIIPVVAIPVSLVGTFVVMAAVGFSINLLTLLGLVLAVGLVVDDAIVVVENVERQFALGETEPHKATSRSMKEVTGSIIATTVVLLAVFVPASFAPGATGQLFNQFALTIAFSVTISAVNSLSLSPALCGVMLRARKEKKRFILARWFNKGFEATANGYARLVGVLTKLWVLVVIVFLVLAALLVVVGKRTPEGFVPTEDQGWFFVFVQLPSGAGQQRTIAVVDQVTEVLMDEPTVKNVISITGYNFLERFEQSNTGVVFALLTPWDERKGHDKEVPGLLTVIDEKLKDIPGAVIAAIPPPSIPGLGSTGGMEFEVLDVQGKGSEALAQAVKKFIGQAEQTASVGKLLPTFVVDVPQLYVDIDREKAESLFVPIQSIYETLQVYLGSVYVNNWNKYGQVYQVLVQADGDARERIEDINRLQVANRNGEMVPLAELVTISTITGPDAIQRYNLYDSALLIGAPKKGQSGSQAIVDMESAAQQTLIPDGFDYAWTGVVFQELDVARYLAIIFVLGIVAVFLVLSGLYESWTLPFVILLSVPLAILGAFVALKLRDIPLDVYGQIALLMMIALAAKNQILIVAFAKQEREAGKGILESAMNAARIRLRPIIMTKSAFIIGVLPLVFASGAGANTRHSIGTTVVGGMLAAAVLSLLMVPVFFVMVEWLRTKCGFGPKQTTDKPV
jgi:HAE1 family hydrophobic/amphiphilic exporter-1